MNQLVQITGSLLILGAFALLQTHKLSVRSTLYLSLNFIGSLILAINAYVTHQWGFLLLEGAWALVTLGGIVQITFRKKKH